MVSLEGKDWIVIDYVVYPFQLLVSWQEKYSDLEKVLKEMLPDGSDDAIFDLNDTAMARCYQFKTGQTVIWFRGLSHGIVAHEIFHAVELFMQFIGDSLSDNSRESYAYLIQYITEEVYKYIKIEENVQPIR